MCRGKLSRNFIPMIPIRLCRNPIGRNMKRLIILNTCTNHLSNSRMTKPRNFILIIRISTTIPTNNTRTTNQNLSLSRTIITNLINTNKIFILQTNFPTSRNNIKINRLCLIFIQLHIFNNHKTNQSTLIIPQNLNRTQINFSILILIKRNQNIITNFFTNNHSLSRLINIINILTNIRCANRIITKSIHLLHIATYAKI